MAKKKLSKKKKLEEKKDEQTLQGALLGQMLTLATSGFGLVAALAWNEAIQSFVRDYIQPFFPNSAFYYKFFYAVFITLIAVLITYQLSRIAAKFKVEKKS
jgi:hypothetical protein